MDNDKLVKKKVASLYKNIRLYLDYIGTGIVSESAGNRKIAELMELNQPFVVGRLGAVEMRCVSKWMQGKEYSLKELEQAKFAAGIFPDNKKILDEFCSVYTSAIGMCDVIGVWEVTGEKRAIRTYARDAQLIPSRAIEPYYYEQPWSAKLCNKRVLIIHPFADSIKKQYTQRKLIWENDNVLPQVKELLIMKAIQSNAGAETSYQDWFEALDVMKERIAALEFDVAIIGAGAYGLPLAAYIKTLGKTAIQMAGATQVLFGIKGKRWDHNPRVSRFYNEHWIRPSREETPRHIEKVEGGSYW